MKVTDAPASTDELDETADFEGAALVGVVLALADGVGEAAVVADAWLLAGAAAAALAACDGSPQPATTASRAADTALTTVKRHARRGCGVGIAELSFDRVG
jgi:hypothetical protein